MSKVENVSRARLVPGSRCGTLGATKCPICLVNQWRSSDYVVVANVYVNEVWDRMEIIHCACYRSGNDTHPAEEYGPAGTPDEYARALSMSGTPKNISVVKSRD